MPTRFSARTQAKPKSAITDHQPSSSSLNRVKRELDGDGGGPSNAGSEVVNDSGVGNNVSSESPERKLVAIDATSADTAQSSSKPEATLKSQAKTTPYSGGKGKGRSKTGASGNRTADVNGNVHGKDTSSGLRVLYWHRTDLRLTDSPALNQALSLVDTASGEGGGSFWPIWIFDPTYVYSHRVGLNRWQFLLESMQVMSEEYSKLNDKQRLWVFRGRPEMVLRRVFEEWGITHLVFEKDSNAYSKVRDTKIKALAEEMGITVVDVPGRHLFDPDEVVKANKGKPTMTLHQWQGITTKMGDVLEPAPTPGSIPDPGPTGIREEGEDWGKYEGIDFNAEIRTGEDTCFEHLTGPGAEPFSVPTFAQLGFDPSGATTTIHGGTIEAHKRLSLFLNQPEKVAKFSKPNTAPTSLEPSTTLLSPYMKFGCVGVREIWWGSKYTIAQWEKEGGRGETKEPENMFGQLEFRDMYACAEAAVPHFERIRGNSVCKFLDWSLSNVYDDQGAEILPRPTDQDDLKSEEYFIKWKEGRTGFPWIDACMRQLKHEGWIHHLARHSVACFLTRGQCYISWERGMEVFDDWLIDWDPSSNPGNWMWLSCSAFFSQYFRVYGLVSWPQRTDKTGVLVRKYCPELKDFPDKYIYAPHTAPRAVQEKANCIIGEDYPEPMLDEQSAKTTCIAKIKNAFHLNLHGDAPGVLDGTAKQKLKELHEESGATEEKMNEAKEKKRKAGGEGAMDRFVKRERK